MAKMMRTSNARQPRPRSTRSGRIAARTLRPATTGDTENGKSISVSSTVRPGNRNRAMAQAAATPKTTFNATATGATANVSRMAWRVSWSRDQVVPIDPEAARERLGKRR